jgi:hypothetical protein
MLNKYIYEQGITLLIKKYASVRIQETLELLINIRDDLYYYDNKLIPIKNDYENLNTIIYILTNNSFVIFETMPYSEDIKNINEFILVHEIKFTTDLKKYFVQILKETINLSRKAFTYKYKELMCIQKFKKITIHKFYTMVNNCIIKLYNIKLIVGTYSSYNISTNIYHSLYIRNSNNSICNIENIFPKELKQYVIIKCEMIFGHIIIFIINVQNLKEY